MAETRGEIFEKLNEVFRDVFDDEAIVVTDATTSAFNEMTESIDFLGVHPQYRKRGIAKAFCEKALYELARSPQISVTTFREGDKADTGYRKIWGGLGFAEAELLVEFGYPTQRFILYREKSEDGKNG